MAKISFFLFFFFFTAGLTAYAADEDGPLTEKPNIFVIAIGINDYRGNQLKNAVNDAQSIAEKIIQDNKERFRDKSLHFKERGRSVAIDSVFTYTHFNENATEEKIRKSFKEIIQKSSTKDYFIFFYAGMTVEISDVESAFLLFQEDEINWNEAGNNSLLRTGKLASWMDQISATNQLVISESCYGKSFAQTLIAELFEYDPLIASSIDRNRIIITTREMGYDFAPGHPNHGPLVSYILQNGNILHAFHAIDFYEFNLIKSEIKNPMLKGRYFNVYQERDYQNFLRKNYNKTNSRGSISNSRDTSKQKNPEPSIYAIVIGNSTYNSDQTDWANLKNPINDANSVADIFEEKYKAQVIKLINKSRTEVLKEILSVKNRLTVNDQLIFFIAGHGYYSDQFSDGFLVFNDSKSLEEDITLDSYLSMADLNRILDGAESKQVFLIFDVCFGASFDPNSADLYLSNYANLESDLTVDEFIARKRSYNTRVFLASGKGEVPDFWNNSMNHSPFASKIIKALQHEETFISPGKLFAALEANVTEPFLKKFGKHEERGDFLLKVDPGSINRRE